ncbi:hypothetical protein F5X99DRAFT_380003 [Biscogniauxia marginata]|nr:hypothetical protein F5X99DRAFT_380003 [Biscogniauxia marginata]
MINENKIVLLSLRTLLIRPSPYFLLHQGCNLLALAAVAQLRLRTWIVEEEARSVIYEVLRVLCLLSFSLLLVVYVSVYLVWSSSFFLIVLY